MKLVNSFDDFLENEVNLNKTRYDRAEEGIEVVERFLTKNDLFGKLIKNQSAQGSFKQETIIKPISDDYDFDVDILVVLEEVEEWEPKDYLEKLHKEFKKTDRYKDIVDKRGKTRCVTLDYESDFHIDIVPCVIRHDTYQIMNRNENRFEATDAEGYSEWFKKKNNATVNKYLTKVVRLLKYLRDYHEAFETKSILLTTLLGNQIYDGDSVDTFRDLPTTLRIIINRLHAYLQENSDMPLIQNPSLEGEDFNRHWTQELYLNFKTKIENYSQLIDDAYDEEDPEVSVEKWRKVFGDEFPLNEDDVSQSTKVLASYTVDNFSHCKPINVIASHEHIQGKVWIKTYLYSKNGKVRYRGISSDARISSDMALKFVAETNISEPFEVYWQIVNTGQHARTNKCLRGGFIKAQSLSSRLSSSKLINWETTAYTGKHWVECFVVKNGIVVARSGKFYINVKNPSYG